MIGRLEVICGPMFSGKSEELLRRIKRAEIGRRPFRLFKPSLDNRYTRDQVASHSGIRKDCEALSDADAILDAVEEGEPCLIGIDEAQFFSATLISVAEGLLLKGYRLVVAGLDMDSSGRPFGPLPSLMAMANTVDKLTAVCSVCGMDATHTYRKSSEPNQILVGAASDYEARCLQHWAQKETKALK